MSTDLSYRLAAIAVCGGLLCGLFILGGMGHPALPSQGPDIADPDTTPEEYAGDHIETGGEVIDTDPVVIEVGDGETAYPLPIEDAPDAATGQELIVDGTLTEEGTLAANGDRAVVREPWETTYMYLISIVGALFVAIRIADGWRFDPRTVTFIPRETPLHTQYLEEKTDG